MNQMPSGGPSGQGFGPFRGNNFRGLGFRGFHHFHPASGFYAHHAYRGGRFRFFPRLFWFALGAGAFAMWKKHEEHEARRLTGPEGAKYGSGHSDSWGCWKWRERERMRAEASAASTPAANTGSSVPPEPSREHQQQGQAGFASGPQFQKQWSWGSNSWGNNNAQTTAPSQTGTSQPNNAQQGEWQNEKFKEMGRQATDAMSDVSEAALDHLISSVQSLKEKLAESRTRREQDKASEAMYLEHRVGTEQQSEKEPKRIV